MYNFTKTWIVTLFIMSMTISLVAVTGDTYEKQVDEVVEKFVAGHNLTDNEIDILSKIIASQNYRYTEVLKAYKYAKEFDLSSGTKIIEQFNSALGKRVQSELVGGNFQKSKTNGITNASIFDEDTDAPGGDTGGDISSAVDATGEWDQITGGFDGPSPDLDVYKIFIADPNNFSAYIDSDFDTMIWLFDSDGYGVIANDDYTPHPYATSAFQSAIPAGHPKGPMEAGVYYLAVASFYNEAQDSSNSDMFEKGGFSSVRGGNGKGPFDHWLDDSDVGGDYVFYLTGVGTSVVLPPPTTGQWTIREDTYFRKTFPAGPDYTASSNTYFVQPRFNGNVLYITPASNWYGTAKVTVTAGASSQDYYLRVTPVNDRPVIFPILDQTINANQTGSVTLDGRDVDNDILVFTASSSSENLTTSINGRTLTFTPAADWSGSADITVLVSDGFLTDAWIFTVTVNSSSATVQRQVSGSLFYGGTKAVLPNTVVVLSNENGNTYETELDEAGSFVFENVNNGYYSMSLVREDGYDPITAADALMAVKYSLDPVTNFLMDMQVAAADVDQSGNVTAGDALSILNRIIGRVDNFESGEWKWNENIVGVGATDLNLYAKTVKTGDVDESLIKGTIGKRNLLLKSSETISIENHEEIVVPVKLGKIDNLSAFDIGLKFDSQNLEFIDLNSGLNVMSNVVEDEIKLAWLNMSLDEGINLDGNETVFELRFRAKGDLPKGYSSNFQSTEGEFLSKDGSRQYPLITIPGISDATPTTFELAQNYPNPFNPSTQISYSLPVSGQVELTIHNVLGEKVATLINGQQEAGTHKVEWNAVNVPSGVYFYSISVNGSQSYVNTKKMLLVK